MLFTCCSPRPRVSTWLLVNSRSMRDPPTWERPSKSLSWFCDRSIRRSWLYCTCFDVLLRSNLSESILLWLAWSSLRRKCRATSILSCETIWLREIFSVFKPFKWWIVSINLNPFLSRLNERSSLRSFFRLLID